MRVPQQVPLAGPPQQVTVYEGGPRDGLQNETAIVSASVKSPTSPGWPPPACGSSR
jgi:hydroxymethylglutaryl-CoA lyase